MSVYIFLKTVGCSMALLSIPSTRENIMRCLLSICMSVCLSVCERNYSKKMRTDFDEIS